MNRSLERWGGGKNNLDKVCKFFIKAYVFLAKFVPKQLVKRKDRFLVCEIFFSSLCPTLVVRKNRFDKVMETGALRGKECVV